MSYVPQFVGLVILILVTALLVSATGGEPKTWRDKCRYANTYRAIFRPTCGCRVCAGKWRDRS